jgi:cytochrome c553
MGSTKSALVALAALMVAPAMAEENGQKQGDPQAGKKIVANGLPDNPAVTACQTCHGMDGSGNPAANWPRLAGQNEAYIYKQLKDFGSGERGNDPTGQMSTFANQLTQQDWRDVAAYYAKQETSIEGADADQQTMSLGEKIAKQGLAEKNVPACTSCHGPQGQGVPPVFPQIGGQHAGYIAKQLRDWANGNRSNEPANMMADIAPKLSDKQRKAVAAYFSNQTPQ